MKTIHQPAASDRRILAGGRREHARRVQPGPLAAALFLSVSTINPIKS